MLGVITAANADPVAELFALRGHSEPIVKVAFNPDGDGIGCA
ncbi:MAG: hypothetical protein R6X31_12390 [Anaerolineae bacterium]